jgi:hypothetical protein
LKDGPQSINAEPRHVAIEGMPRLVGRRDKGAEGAAVEPEYRSGPDRAEANWMQAARHVGVKLISVAMLLHVIILPSHMACAQVPT